MVRGSERGGNQGREREELGLVVSVVVKGEGITGKNIFLWTDFNTRD